MNFIKANPAQMHKTDGIVHELKKDLKGTAFEVRTQIMAEEIEDIIVAELEGVGAYWCGIDNTLEDWKNAPKDLPVAQYAAALLLAGKAIMLYDIEDEDETWILTLQGLLDGIGRFMAQEKVGIDSIVDEPDGAFQFALFGKIVYA